jgi:hypothetical protein
MALEFRTDFELFPGESTIKDPIKIGLRYLKT